MKTTHTYIAGYMRLPINILLLALCCISVATRAQTLKYLNQGVSSQKTIYRNSISDSLGNLHVLVCDSSMTAGSGSIMLSATFHIETWNGCVWIASRPVTLYTKARFKSDVIRSPDVGKMLVYRGSVVIAGKFDSTSGNLGGGIIAWNGTKWAKVGNGLYVSSKWEPNSFQSWFEMKNLFVYKSKLMITGNFDSIKGAYANGVAQLNSSGIWENLSNMKGFSPFQVHKPDASHFYQVVSPEIDVVLDSMFMYQSIAYIPDKQGYNGSFEPVMNSRQSRQWTMNGLMGTTLYSSDGFKQEPVSIPPNFVVRRVFEQNGELNLLGHSDSSYFIKQIAHRDASGKWTIITLPDNDSFTVLNGQGLVEGYCPDSNKYMFLARMNTTPNGPVKVIKLYAYDGSSITSKSLLREDSTRRQYKLMKSGKKNFLAGSYLHLQDWNTSRIDSFYNYSAELSMARTIVVKGRAFIDRNLNKTWQAHEPMLKNKMIYCTKTGHVTCTDAHGNYVLYLPGGESRDVVLTTNQYYTPAWVGAKIFSNYNDTFISCDLPMDVLNQKDLRVELIPYYGPKARRGATSRYAIRVANISGKPVSHIDVKLTLAKKIAEFVPIGSVAIYDPVRRNAYWSFSGNLGADSSLYLYFTCKYSADSFVYGDSVYTSVRIQNTYGDADTSNNIMTVKQFISAAHDPNMKESDPKGRITAKPDRITYTIHFQNMGTDTAIRVHVLDTLSVITPVYEVEIGAASHEFNCWVNNGIIAWEFNNIKLTPMSENESGSSGFLAFAAKINKPFKVGDSLRNRAGIYFDYEQPVITNYASIVMVKEDDGVPEIPVLAGFSAYPNPASTVQILRNNMATGTRIRIYASNGQLVHESGFLPYEEKEIDMQHWAPGCYVIITETGATLRIIKL